MLRVQFPENIPCAIKFPSIFDLFSPRQLEPFLKGGWPLKIGNCQVYLDDVPFLGQEAKKPFHYEAPAVNKEDGQEGKLLARGLFKLLNGWRVEVTIETAEKRSKVAGSHGSYACFTLTMQLDTSLRYFYSSSSNFEMTELEPILIGKDEIDPATGHLFIALRDPISKEKTRVLLLTLDETPFSFMLFQGVYALPSMHNVIASSKLGPFTSSAPDTLDVLSPLTTFSVKVGDEIYIISLLPDGKSICVMGWHSLHLPTLQYGKLPARRPHQSISPLRLCVAVLLLLVFTVLLLQLNKNISFYIRISKWL